MCLIYLNFFLICSLELNFCWSSLYTQTILYENKAILLVFRYRRYSRIMCVKAIFNHYSFLIEKVKSNVNFYILNDFHTLEYVWLSTYILMICLVFHILTSTFQCLQILPYFIPVASFRWYIVLLLSVMAIHWLLSAMLCHLPNLVSS